MNEDLPESMILWAQAKGLSPEEFQTELWNTVISLGNMMIDHDEENDSDTVTISVENDNPEYNFEMDVRIVRTLKGEIK